MSDVKIRANFGNLKNYQKRLLKAFSGNEDRVDADKFFKDVLNTAAQRTLYGAEQRTPVDTGQLRKNWKMTSATKRGWNYAADVENPVEYASYVEFGHRPNWRNIKKDKPNKGKLKFNGKSAWVEGSFMLTKAIDETRQNMPSLVNEKINKLRRELES